MAFIKYNIKYNVELNREDLLEGKYLSVKSLTKIVRQKARENGEDVKSVRETFYLALRRGRYSTVNKYGIDWFDVTAKQELPVSVDFNFIIK